MIATEGKLNRIQTRGFARRVRSHENRDEFESFVEAAPLEVARGDLFELHSFNFQNRGCILHHEDRTLRRRRCVLLILVALPEGVPQVQHRYAGWGGTEDRREGNSL